MEIYDHAYFYSNVWWDTAGAHFKVQRFEGAFSYATEKGWKLQGVHEGYLYFIRKR